MKMKFWLYIGFFAVFTFVFTQIAFPLGATVGSINVGQAGGDGSFIEYEIFIESTGLIPVDIVNGRISVEEDYKSRVNAGVTELYENNVSVFKASTRKIRIPADTGGMSKEEIEEMVKNIEVHFTWKTMAGQGWERENRVYLPEDIVVLE